MKIYYFIAILLSISAAQASSTSDDRIKVSGNRFEIIKGRDREVCQAYLGKLNGLNQIDGDPESNPLCGRPEVSSVKGFNALSRIRISKDQYAHFATSVFNYSNPLMPLPLTKKIKGEGPNQDPIPMIDVSDVRDFSRLPIWTYSRPLDIENNGKPLNILVWRGYGADPHSDYCGQPENDGQIKTSIQLAYILTPDSSTIDEKKTDVIFNYFKSESNRTVPFPLSVSIFSYKSRIYFDAFYNFTDMFGNKNTRAGFEKLGVFEHKNHQTNLVCEFLMY